MAHLSNPITSDFTNERLPPVSSHTINREASHHISTILRTYKVTKDILGTIHEIESLSDFELLNSIYETLLQRAPSASEANDPRIDSIREHILRQLSELYCSNLQSLHTLLIGLQFDAIAFNSEERKNLQLQNALLELLSASKMLTPGDDNKSVEKCLERLHDVHERHCFYQKILDTSPDAGPSLEIGSEKKTTELYWARRLEISHDHLITLLEQSPLLIPLCEYMDEKGLPVVLVPARITWLSTTRNVDSNEKWLRALDEYYKILLPIERHSNLLDPSNNKTLFTHSEGIYSQIELLNLRRSEPNWITVLCCRILCEEGIKLLRRQRHLAYLAPEIAKLVAEDYYGALVSTGMKHGDALLPLVPKNSQKGFDSAVEILRSQQLLKREYFSPSRSNKISQFFSPGGKEHVMWKAFLNLLVALEKGTDSFEVALRESKTPPEKVFTRSLDPENTKKTIKALLQDSLTTLRVLTYQVGEIGKSSEYQSQLGVLRQSLTKVPTDSIQESHRKLYELCKNLFFLPQSPSTEIGDLRGEQFILAQLIAITRRNCAP
jgi:hypothetical protein